MKWFLLGFIILFSSRVNAGDWIFASGRVAFSIKNAGLAVNGSFSGLKASVKFDPEQISKTQLEGSVQVNTLETGIQLRNQHLKKEAYFNAEKFPEISMKLLHLASASNGWVAEFLLIMKGVQQKIRVPVSFYEKENTARLTTLFPLNRRHFGVGGSSWTMSDTVDVSIEFQLKPS